MNYVRAGIGKGLRVRGDVACGRSGIGNDSGDSGDRGGFGRYEIDFRVGRSRASLEVAIEGSERDAGGVRREAHADAGTARAFENAESRADEFAEHSGLFGLHQRLAASGGNSRFDALGDMLALDDCGNRREVGKRAVGAAADDHLRYFFSCELRDRRNGVGRVGTGGEGLERGKIDLDYLVVHGALVGCERDEIFGTAHRGEKRFRRVVGRKYAAGRAELGAHIRDGRALGNAEVRHAASEIFIDAADAALHGFAPQHFEDNVFGGNA